MVVKLRPFWLHAPAKFFQYTKAIVHPSVLEDAAKLHLSTSLGQYLGLIHGKGSAGEDNPYPSAAKGSGLMDPRAIFRGIKRPIGKSESGTNIFAYVTNPTKSYRLDIEYFLANIAKSESDRLRLIEEPAPDDSVLVSFVSTDTQVLDEAREYAHDPLAEVQAVVIGWEWTLAMPDDTGLPFDHQNRYAEPILCRPAK